ncbi:glycosyltransferase, group 2 family protein [[Clostridium] methylpentosum DSM 5476]|uniref:Glycosyltransferase, group 2 family protein n=1 Tax=[Clostridium] methylpentosum DSM 5476 TaxID=537013 RepID=C0EG74_9FIRM|nr:glycosyltransferase, group 2 family protein [[Clostridium] methylpentosum DSM 5476]MDY3988196.1 glycosyltransferase family 2 protein [Massilioclostridium sp.]MEE1492128.1 glycosyltransferase family 2 protein [Massilioclostridium sp.]
MLSFINNFNFVILIFFTLCYSYQFVYAFVALVSKPKTKTAKKLHRYAVIISARNESAVIGELIKSIKQQNYPAELVDVYVVADNCTDNTAEVSRNAGAIVYERFNQQYVGKGYALDYIFNIIHSSPKKDAYDGYFVFDADNLLDENYIAEMNKVFDSGYRVVTSYRNSKNYATNWISAGYSLWFLREAKYLNNARMQLGTSCAISGTGFLIHSDIIKENGGWKHHLLTEDIEFSIDSVIKGEIIGYCGAAKIYDEQPSSFEQSWNQRLRWSKGFYQVFGKYGAKLAKSVVKRRSFSCYDMLMTISPAMFVTIASVFTNLVFLMIGMFSLGNNTAIIPTTLMAIASSFLNFYCILYFFGLLTTITEWNQIHCSAGKKIFYTFTFPIFIFTYIPIAIVALFKKVEWTPITHSVVKSIEEVRQ